MTSKTTTTIDAYDDARAAFRAAGDALNAAETAARDANRAFDDAYDAYRAARDALNAEADRQDTETMTSHTIYHTDGESYTGQDALDRLWAEIAAGDSLAAISPALAEAAHAAIDVAGTDGPLGLTPDSAHSVIDGIEVRSFDPMIYRLEIEIPADHYKRDAMPVVEALRTIASRLEATGGILDEITTDGHDDVLRAVAGMVGR